MKCPRCNIDPDTLTSGRCCCPTTVPFTFIEEMLKEIEQSVIPADVDVPDNVVWKIAKKYGYERKAKA